MAGRRVRGVRVGVAAAACLGLALAGAPASGVGGTSVDPAAPVAAPVLVPLVGGSLPPGEAGPAGTGASAAEPPASGAAADPSTPGTTDGPSAGTPGAAQESSDARAAGSGASAAASTSAAVTPAPSGSPGGGAAQVGAAMGDPLDPDLAAEAVGSLLRGGALGPGRTATSIVDLASGEVLYGAAADDAVTPASTMKLVTAASVLTSLGPDAVLRTRTTILDPAAATPRVVLVGSGDPSLAATPGRVGGNGTRIEPAALSDLASATARSLAARGIDTVRIGYDASAFTGPALHPTWAPSFPAGGIVAPVSALQVDQGRRTPTSIGRVADPARAAAQRFAEQLAEAGIEVTGRLKPVRERPESVALASVSSPPVSRLVERMLATSDNDYAEALARLAAAQAGHPASFEGVSRRGAQVLADLGIGTPGDQVADGSGLSRANALTPATLTDLLRRTTPTLGSIDSGLPIGGTTGSLRSRYDTRATDAARGVVRAKTGTLTGVVGLAGYVSRPDGRLLAFAVLDDSVPGGAFPGRAAIDRALAALVTCDCAAG